MSNSHTFWRTFGHSVDADIRIAGQQMTHTSEVFVEEFNVSMNDLQSEQLVVALFYSTAEVKTCVSVGRTTDKSLEELQIETQNLL